MSAAIHFANYPFPTLCARRWNDDNCTAIEGRVTCKKCLAAISDMKEQDALLHEGETPEHKHNYKLTTPPFYLCSCGAELALLDCMDGRRRFRRYKTNHT